MHVRPISIPRSTSPHDAAQAQPHRRARLRAHISMHTMARTHMACRHSRARGTYLVPRRTSAPCCSSVCTTAACPSTEARCKLVLPSWRAGVRSAAGPQRQERPRQAATLSRAVGLSDRRRTLASIKQMHLEEIFLGAGPAAPGRAVALLTLPFPRSHLDVCHSVASLFLFFFRRVEGRNDGSKIMFS